MPGVHSSTDVASTAATEGASPIGVVVPSNRFSGVNGGKTSMAKEYECKPKLMKGTLFAYRAQNGENG